MNATTITNTLIEIRESKNMNEMVRAIELIRPFLQMNSLLADPAYADLMHEVTKDLAWMQDVNIAVRDLQCTLRILTDYMKKYHGAYFDEFVCCTFVMQLANLINMIGSLDHYFDEEVIAIIDNIKRYVDRYMMKEGA